MCGICGQFNLDHKPVDPTSIEAMNSAIGHRGPDSAGVHVDGPIGLGHRRLSIIDLSAAGRQPMYNDDGSMCIVFNGEIYNFEELEKELACPGVRFRSRSDTEVLLRLYERHGAACLEKLRGMFAFAVWDSRRGELFLARDRIGIKPLYYYQDDDTFLFASEMKAILQSGDVPRELNHNGLLTYFTFGHSVAPDTILLGVKKLLPGHFMVRTATESRITKYWDIDGIEQRRGVDEEEATTEVRRLLEDAVRSHMVSDVPVGAFLSGGIDSSAAVAFMTRHSSAPIKTFAVGFDVGGYYNELDDARRIAHRFETNHHEMIVRELDLVELLNRLVRQYDEPFADAANLPTLIISEFARQHVKVVLSGEGGDEVFGGYRRYYAELVSRYYRVIPALLRDRVIRKLVRPTPRFRRLHKAVETMGITEPDVRYGHWLCTFTSEAKAELFSTSVQEQLDGFDHFWHYRDYYNRNPRWDTLNRILYTDLKTWLPDTYLEKLDKATMAVSLEGRVPFLDHHLVEYAFSLHGELKLRGRTTKWILKEALKGVLPDSTLYKPKHGFAVPLDEWFRGGLKSFVSESLLDGSIRSSGLFDMRYIERIIRCHMARQQNLGIHLWTLLNFKLWYGQTMEQVVHAH
jgi:asparagine synthase (glutamine-hydrolysing)